MIQPILLCAIVSIAGCAGTDEIDLSHETSLSPTVYSGWISKITPDMMVLRGSSGYRRGLQFVAPAAEIAVAMQDGERVEPDKLKPGTSAVYSSVRSDEDQREHILVVALSKGITGFIRSVEADAISFDGRQIGESRNHLMEASVPPDAQFLLDGKKADKSSLQPGRFVQIWEAKNGQTVFFVHSKRGADSTIAEVTEEKVIMTPWSPHYTFRLQSNAVEVSINTIPVDYAQLRVGMFTSIQLAMGNHKPHIMVSSHPVLARILSYEHPTLKVQPLSERRRAKAEPEPVSLTLHEATHLLDADAQKMDQEKLADRFKPGQLIEYFELDNRASEIQLVDDPSRDPSNVE